MQTIQTRHPYAQANGHMNLLKMDHVGRTMDDVLEGFEPVASGGYRRRPQHDNDNFDPFAGEPAGFDELRFE